MSSDGLSASKTWASTTEDLNARARIRNAALELHADKGEAGTTVREVAQAAGVTHGLVVHYFQNKQGLKRAVQQHVVDLLRQALEAVPGEGTAAEIGRARDATVAGMFAAHPAALRYLRRSLLDPADTDSELLDLLADFTLAQVRDLRAAGIATSNTPEPTQAYAILMRELAPRLLEPVTRKLWAHLTDGAADPPPALGVKLTPATAVG